MIYSKDKNHPNFTPLSLSPLENPFTILVSSNSWVFRWFPWRPENKTTGFPSFPQLQAPVAIASPPQRVLPRPIAPRGPVPRLVVPPVVPLRPGQVAQVGKKCKFFTKGWCLGLGGEMWRRDGAKNNSALRSRVQHSSTKSSGVFLQDRVLRLPHETLGRQWNPGRQRQGRIS